MGLKVRDLSSGELTELALFVVVGSGIAVGGTGNLVVVDERLELLLEAATERPLWWRAQYDEVLSEWSELEGLGQLAGLVKSLATSGDWLQLEDKDPTTRYAQIMLIDEGLFHVETAARRPEGVCNWRIGYDPSADDAGNSPTSGAERVQELDTASTVEVLSSWAAGRGLPLGYGTALCMY